jgi:protein-disulfide isomerase
MARKPIKRKAARDRERGVNWMVIVGIVAAAVLLLGGLMLLSLNSVDEDGPTMAQASVPAYCEQNPDNCVAIGAETAPVRLVEVFDFACIHCRNFNQDALPVFKNQYLASGQVRFVSFPFAARPETLPATNASLCANEQGAYFEYSKAVFSQFGEAGYLSRDQLLQTAVALNLDRDSFAACMDEGRYNIVVSDNVGHAHSVGVTSTPNFFINGIQVTGNQPDLIRQHIERMLGN